MVTWDLKPETNLQKTWAVSQWVGNIGCHEGGSVDWRQGERGSRVLNLKQNSFSEVGGRITHIRQKDGGTLRDHVTTCGPG